MSLAKLTHQFVEKTYHKWTFCDHCNKLLWGLVKQGVECTECGFISHKKCLDHISYSCDHLFSSNSNTLLEDEEGGDVSREVPQMFDTSEVLSDSEISLVKRTPSRYQRANAAAAVAAAAGKYDSGTLSPVPRSPTSGGIVQDLIVSTAAKSIELQNKLVKPELSLALNGRNFARFTVRAAVIADLEDTLEGIFTWQQPSVTLLCMVAYAAVCLYPGMLLMTPYALLVYLIVKNYFYRAQRIAMANGRPLSSLPPEPSPIVKIGSAQYKRNLTHIQNSMGLFADTFDAVRMQMTHLDWSDEQDTMNILKLVLLGWFATAVTLYFVPWNYVLLVGGELGFLANTAIAQAFADTIAPKLLVAVKAQFSQVRRKFQPTKVPVIQVDAAAKPASESPMSKAKTIS